MGRGKPRGNKLDGRDANQFCGDCMSWHCDSRSDFMTDKIQRRRKEGVHFSCGNNPCTCRDRAND